ncbi:sulfatase [Pasteurellaceae bacterium Pebbles2]|nr:sulfatase [Pasteurellaceae bacterium Pebbles2]
MLLQKIKSSLSFSSTKVIALVALYFTAVLNLAFYKTVLNAHPFTGAPEDYFLLTVPLFVFFTLNAAFQIIALPILHKVIIPLFLVLSAAISYQELFFGIYFDNTMLENVLQTNPAETARMITLPYVTWIICLGVIPAILYTFIKIKYRTFIKEIACRVATIALSAFVVWGISKFYYQDYASFVRNNKAVTHLIVPSNFIGATVSKVKQYYNANRTFQHFGLEAKQAKPDNARHVMFLVVGETTRAQNWGLNGYARQTTPLLAKREQQGELINFHNVTSCGTSTAYSVPCMFSTLPRDKFSVNDADYQDNLLDILQRAGVETMWIDNNSDCKGVCARTPNLNVTNIDLADYCHNGECLDDVLFIDIEKFLHQSDKDTVIILHTIGNHGPTYHERYTPEYRQFTPTCDTNEIQKCSNDQLVNTYDNGILYVDYFLNKAIGYLEKEKGWEAALFYMSDHGESLGENGIYLHGTPYAIAPKEQTHIPAVMWLSPSWQKNEKIDMQCLQNKAKTGEFSHDNLFHTTFAMMDMSLDLPEYKPELDILAQCKKAR